MSDGSSQLVEVARAEFGDALRAVIRYRVEDGVADTSVEYVRDDVASGRNVEEYADGLSRDHTFESIETDWHERIHDAGDLQASVRVFEREASIRLHDDVGTGYSVHVDPDRLGDLATFLDAADRRLA